MTRQCIGNEDYFITYHNTSFYYYLPQRSLLAILLFYSINLYSSNTLGDMIKFTKTEALSDWCSEISFSHIFTVYVLQTLEYQRTIRVLNTKSRNNNINDRYNKYKNNNGVVEDQRRRLVFVVVQVQASNDHK